jgi:hypothetical protein
MSDAAAGPATAATTQLTYHVPAHCTACCCFQLLQILTAAARALRTGTTTTTVSGTHAASAAATADESVVVNSQSTSNRSNCMFCSAVLRPRVRCVLHAECHAPSAACLHSLVAAVHVALLALGSSIAPSTCLLGQHGLLLLLLPWLLLASMGS